MADGAPGPKPTSRTSQYSSRVSPFQANTAAVFDAAIAAAAWSCVLKMLQLHQRTSAPRNCEAYRSKQMAAELGTRPRPGSTTSRTHLKRLDEDRSLDGHVQRPSDAGTLKGLARTVLGTNGHEARLSTLQGERAQSNKGKIAEKLRPSNKLRTISTSASLISLRPKSAREISATFDSVAIFGVFCKGGAKTDERRKKLTSEESRKEEMEFPHISSHNITRQPPHTALPEIPLTISTGSIKETPT